MYKRKVSETTKKIVAARQGWRCAACSQLLSPFFEVDHIVALWRGGSNDPSNLQALDRECHAAKGARERLEHQAPPPDVEREQTSAIRSAQMFNALFEPWAGGAFPLAVAKRLCAMRFGTAFDERAIAVEVSPFMVYPPHWASLYVQAGMVPRREGPVLQAVRLRKENRTVSTRAV